MNRASAFVLSGLLLAAAAPAFAAGTWSSVSSPNATAAPTEPTAITCVTPSDCWAVGKAGGGLDLNTVTMHWNGEAWLIVPSPNVDEKATHLLEDVACVASSDCWAVGYYFLFGSFEVRPFALHWDGAGWDVDTSLGNGSGWSRLNGVSCASASDCWAVGSDAGGGAVQPLIAHWNGNRWQRVATPAFDAALGVLHDVACASAANCWAVGSAGAATSLEATLALRWNGMTWAAVASPNSASTTENVLSAVTCNTAVSCFAVGHTFDGASYTPLALQWAGVSWAATTVVATPSAEGYELADVACATSQDCWAVGDSTESGTLRPVRLRYNGLAWIAGDLPDPAASYGSSITGVFCGAAASCWTVGSIRPADIARSHIERWDGTSWSAVPAPAGSVTQSNLLRGMTCLSSTDCWAVGIYFSGSVAVSLIQHWDGVRWQIVPSPNTALDRNNYLQEISCVTASDCWAVGSSASTLGIEGQPLAMHWDGSAWSIAQVQALDTHAVQDYSLTGVACVTSSDCWAVGHVVEQYYRGAIVHWDGASWTASVVPHQGLPSEGNALYGITCVAADDCWAVGDQWTANGPYGSYYTVIVHWDGTSWSLVDSPLVNAERDNRLFSVACPGADDCWAVGNAYHANGDKSLVGHWDGSSWQLATPPPGLGFLYDLSCASSTNCWAVGHPWQVEGGQNRQTFSAHWDGQAWSTVTVPKPGATSSLDAVACTSNTDCFAVGSYSVAASAQTLALRFTPRQSATPFTYLERTGVATNVFVTSESKTLSGFSGTLPVSIDNGQYRIDNGAWTTAAGQIGAGSTLAVRHVSAGTAGAETLTRVSVGDYGTPFRSVTSSLDRTPDAFTLGARTGVDPGVPVESDVVTLTGFNTGIAIVPGAGIAYCIDGGAWVTGSGTLQPGQTLQARHTSSGSALGYTKTWLKAGGVVGYFTTRTR